MINQFFLFVTLVLLTGTLSISCSEDIPDCPSRMCIVAGAWRLTEVYVDDELFTGDLTQYKLTLYIPSPATATVSNFDRIQPGGTIDDGSWSLVNNESILRLVPDDNELLLEDWVIKSMTPRQMVLIMNRDVSIKAGPAKIEYILEPF